MKTLEDRIKEREENIALAESLGSKLVHPTLFPEITEVYEGKYGIKEVKKVSKKHRNLQGYDIRVANFVAELRKLQTPIISTSIEDAVTESNLIYQTL